MGYILRNIMEAKQDYMLYHRTGANISYLIEVLLYNTVNKNLYHSIDIGFYFSSEHIIIHPFIYKEKGLIKGVVIH